MMEPGLFLVGQGCGPYCWGYFSPKLSSGPKVGAFYSALVMIIASYQDKYQMINLLASCSVPALLLLYLLEGKAEIIGQG